MPPRPVRATYGDHEEISHNLVDFVDEYREASEIKHAEIARNAEKTRKSKRKKANSQADDDVAAAIAAIDYAALAREERQSVAERLKVGYVWENERTFGSDYFLPPFVEHGLRSWNDPINKMFVAAAPKARNLQCGPRKDSAFIRRRKIWALDQPYVRFNQIVRFGWRIDIDAVFNGIDDLIAQWKRCVPDFLPHKVVGHINGARQLVRPHVWVLFAPGNALWYDRSDLRCNISAMWLYDYVGLGIVDRLRNIGADPAAMGDPLRGKNPLSPLWSAWTVNATDFRSMKEYAEVFGIGRGRDVQIREAAEIKSGLGTLSSNLLFTELRRTAWSVLKDWASIDDPQYLEALSDRGILADLLEQRMGPEARRTFDAKPTQVMAVLRRVVVYAAGDWDPKRTEVKQVVRGALRGQLEKRMNLHERQSAGGKHSGKVRVERSVEAIGRAIMEAKEAGEKITKASIARRASTSRPTVHANWEAAVLYANNCKARCIVKEQTLSRITLSTVIPEMTNADRLVRPAAPERKTNPRPTFLNQNPIASEDHRPTAIINDNNVSQERKSTIPGSSTTVSNFRRPAFLSRGKG